MYAAALFEFMDLIRVIAGRRLRALMRPGLAIKRIYWGKWPTLLSVG